MKKDLKLTIFETVSNLRQLFVKLKDSSDSKSSAISELETVVTKMKAELAGSNESTRDMDRHYPT
jgi:hypothetical protein